MPLLLTAKERQDGYSGANGAENAHGECCHAGASLENGWKKFPEEQQGHEQTEHEACGGFLRQEESRGGQQHPGDSTCDKGGQALGFYVSHNPARGGEGGENKKIDFGDVDHFAFRAQMGGYRKHASFFFRQARFCRMLRPR
jgi:hypothetical protein